MHATSLRALAFAASLSILPVGAWAQALGDANGAIEAEVLRLINVERANVGLSALYLDLGLDAAAEAHSLDMATTPCFQHDSCNGGSWAARVQASYTAQSTIGEIIAGGFQTPADVVAGWMNSPGHKANILNSSFKVAGLAYAPSTVGTYRTYWTVDFGGAVTSNTVMVPEPATWALMGLGLVGIAGLRRSRP